MFVFPLISDFKNSIASFHLLGCIFTLFEYMLLELSSCHFLSALHTTHNYICTFFNQMMSLLIPLNHHITLLTDDPSLWTLYSIMILGSLRCCHMKFLFTTNRTCDLKEWAGIFVVTFEVLIIHSFATVDAILLTAEDLSLGKKFEHLGWNGDVVAVVFAPHAFIVSVLLRFWNACCADELLTMLALLWIVH